MKAHVRLSNLLVIMAALSIAQAAAASSSGPPVGCPEGTRLLWTGDGPGAERAARGCLAVAPDDAQLWMLLGRSLAIQAKYSQALSWLDRALARHPHDADIVLAKARTLMWAGNHDAAWSVVAPLPPSAFATFEDALFVARLAAVRHDSAEAHRRFEHLERRWPNDPQMLRSRGQFRATEGHLEQAASDFSAACLARDDASCHSAEEIAERQSFLRMYLAPGYTLLDREDLSHGLHGWNLPVAISARVTDALHVGASIERRSRDFGEGPLSDTFVATSLSVRLDRRFGLSLGAGTTLGRRFSPRFSGEIEPSVALGAGWELLAKYWRLDFPDGGAHVLSPAVLWEGRQWNVYARAFMALPDKSERSQSGMLRIGRDLGDRFALSAGGGGGNGVDYLEIREGAHGKFWFALAGATVRFGWRNRVNLTYVQRRESAVTSLDQKTLSLGYEMRM